MTTHQRTMSCLSEALARSVQLGMVEEACQLLQRGADSNGLVGGRLPLQRALCRNVQYDSLPMVKLLLEHGAEPSRTDNVFGSTPLHAAALHSVAATRLLLDKGGNIRARDKTSRTPLLSAALHGQPEIIDLLLSKGADPNDADENGLSALHMAAINHDPAVARLLLRFGANPNVIDQSGHSPLHKAASEGSAETIQALIEGGADVNAPNARGRAPLHLATLSSCFSPTSTERIAALVSSGGDVQQRDKQGSTPLSTLTAKPHVLMNQHCFLSILGIFLGAGATLRDIPGFGECPLLKESLSNLLRGCNSCDDTFSAPLSDACIAKILRGYSQRLLDKLS